MRLTRYLNAEQVKLDLETAPPEPLPETWTKQRLTWHLKEGVIEELVRLLETTGRVNNRNKLLQDLINREKKASTGIGGGLAIPHVRSMQAREFTMAFGRSRRGLDFDSIDGQPVQFFICVVSPPYDDKLYLQVYKRLGEVFGREETKAALMATEDAHEIVRILTRFDED